MKKLIIAAASTGIFLLAACSSDSKDFKETAEDFIESDEVENLASATFSDTTCTEPGSTDVGETFTCTSTDTDGKIWEFDVVIDAKDHFEVTNGTSFAKEVQKFIEGEEVATQAGTTFTGADCTNPAVREAGQSITCTAVDADGTTWDFTVDLTSEDTFEIQSGEPRA